MGQRARILFHPDYTVGPGVTPDLLTQVVAGNHKALAGYTAGGELHPALRILDVSVQRLWFSSVDGK